MTRIFVEDIELDINGELSQQLTFAIDDLNNLDSKSTSFSKTIVIAGTNRNNQIFGNIFEFGNSNFDNLSQPNVYYNFNASRSARARIEINGLQAMKGVMRLLSIVVDNAKVEYEIALFGELGGFVSALSNRKLTDIDWSIYNHKWNYDNIILSWDLKKQYTITSTSTFDNGDKKIIIPIYIYGYYIGDTFQISGSNSNDGIYTIKSILLDPFSTDTIIYVNESLSTDTDSSFNIRKVSGRYGNGYTYPLINYGNSTYTTATYTKYLDFEYTAFRPAIYVKTYFDRIMESCGYTYESNFFNSDLFNRLIIPHNDKEVYKSDVTIFANLHGTASASGNTAVEISYNLPITGSRIDFSYNSTTKTLTYTGTSTRQIKIKTTISGTISLGNAQTASLSLVHNGIALSSYGLDVFNPNDVDWYIEKVISVSNGDTINLNFYGLANTPSIIAPSSLIYWNIALSESLYIQNDPAELIPYLYDDLINFNDIVPKNISQKDFITSLMKMFNLMVVEDKYKEKHLIIEPYIDFFDLDRTSYEDWSNKVDRSKPIKIKPMSEANSRYYDFKYKQDSDYYAEEYRKKYNESYGDRKFDNQLEFAKDSQSVEVIFSSSVLTGFEGFEKIYPTILKKSGDTEERISSNIRIMQSKLIENLSNVYLIHDGTTTYGTAIKYMYAGHLDDPFFPTSDINWGSPKEVKFTLTQGSLSNNLFNSFYSPYMAEIIDKDSRLITCEMYLNEIDIFRLDFSKFKMIDGVLYRLSKVIDWSSPSTCKVDLLRVINTTYMIDNNYSNSARLCNAVWSSKNLDVLKFRNGDSIRFIDNQGDWDYYSNGLREPCCCYYNFSSGSAHVGLLYNWYAVNDVRGLAPDGWRISTESDWLAAETCDPSTYNLMSKGLYDWNGGFGTDKYGFNALSNGKITQDGTSTDIKDFAYWWTSKEVDFDNAKYQRFIYNSSSFDLRDGLKAQGMGIRIVKI